jgi:conjugative relaxase-like TrwC/TraI family protein
MGPRNIPDKNQAKDYYYGRDHFHSADQSHWHGELCELLKYSGTVQIDDFLNALDGKNREGVQLTRVYQNRRIGLDFVFEAPKSVSIAIRMLDDDRLIKAVDESVNIALNILEKEAIYTRYTDDNGSEIRENTGKMITSVYPHSTSRSCIDQNDNIQAPDMHEHRHVVIMNITQNSKNKWLAIDNQPIYDHQRYFHSIFQSELAKRVQEMDYGIKLKPNGNWEIAGIDQECIDTFSKRRFAIDARFKELKESMKFPKMDDSQLRDIAANETRLDKDMSYTQAQLLDIWADQVNPKLMKENVEKKKYEKQIPNSDILKDAYTALHKKTSAFTKIELTNIMLQMSRSIYGIDEIETIIDDAIKTGSIQFIGTKTIGKYYEYETFASKEMVNLEKRVVTTIKNSFGIQEPLADEQRINETLKKHQYLSTGQADAIEITLKSKDKYIFIQGDPGTGKTTAMKVINDVLKGSNCKILGLTHTGSAALELKQKAEIESKTLDSFLKFPKLSLSDRHLFILDEDSMVDSFKVDQLIEFAEKHANVTLLCVGDWKQLQPIGAGRLFSDMLEIFKNKVIEITEARRFKTEMMKFVADCLKEYQEGVNKNGIIEVVNKLELENFAIFEPDNAKLVDQLISDFILEPDDSLIVCATNEDKDYINRLCKMALQAEKMIEQEEMSVKSFKKIETPLVGRNLANQFRPGDKIFIERAIGLSANQIAEVHRLSGDHTIIIKIDDIIFHEINLNKDRVKGIEERTIGLSKGTRVVFTHNDYRLGVRNGTSGKVVSIDHDKGNLQIDTGGDKPVSINKDYGLIDLGYAATAHKTQGMDAKRVMVYANSGRGMLNSELFYVVCTRASHELRIYSDNKANLINKVSEHQYKASTINLPAMKFEEKQSQYDFGCDLDY